MITANMKKALIEDFNAGEEIIFMIDQRVIMAHKTKFGSVDYDIYEEGHEANTLLSLRDGGIFEDSLEEFLDEMDK
jgi:hypothetical protein